MTINVKECVLWTVFTGKHTYCLLALAPSLHRRCKLGQVNYFVTLWMILMVHNERKNSNVLQFLFNLLQVQNYNLQF